MNDVVVDTNVACLFDAPPDVRIAKLFGWLVDKGWLAVSQHLLNEYSRQGSRLLAVLVRDLTDKKRLNKITNAQVNAFSSDRHFSYCCNPADIKNARTVFLSYRKILVTFDANLRKDVDGFKKVDGVKPSAYEYAPEAILI